jgi:hypothetical protein
VANYFECVDRGKRLNQHGRHLTERDCRRVAARARKGGEPLQHRTEHASMTEGRSKGGRRLGQQIALNQGCEAGSQSRERIAMHADV